MVTAVVKNYNMYNKLFMVIAAGQNNGINDNEFVSTGIIIKVGNHLRGTECKKEAKKQRFYTRREAYCLKPAGNQRKGVVTRTVG